MEIDTPSMKITVGIHFFFNLEIFVRLLAQKHSYFRNKACRSNSPQTLQCEGMHDVRLTTSLRTQPWTFHNIYIILYYEYIYIHVYMNNLYKIIYIYKLTENMDSS